MGVAGGVPMGSVLGVAMAWFLRGFALHGVCSSCVETGVGADGAPQAMCCPARGIAGGLSVKMGAGHCARISEGMLGRGVGACGPWGHRAGATCDE